MTPEATLWAEAQQLPLVTCPDIGTYDGETRCPTCGHTPEDDYLHEVRSDVYRAVERAVTVPCDLCGGDGEGLFCERGEGMWVAPGICPNDQTPIEVRRCARCNGTGRVLRPQPGVMACLCGIERDIDGAFRNLCSGCQVYVDAQSGQGRFHIANHTHCSCGGSGTVPDPSEAGVRARAQQRGLLWDVWAVLPVTLHKGQLHLALTDLDYDGALAATLAAVQALAAQEVA